jgi:hypothetical protein
MPYLRQLPEAAQMCPDRALTATIVSRISCIMGDKITVQGQEYIYQKDVSTSGRNPVLHC